jgi:hypothetical protein
MPSPLDGIGDFPSFAFRQRGTSASTAVDASAGDEHGIRRLGLAKKPLHQPLAVRRANCVISSQYEISQRPKDTNKETLMATSRPVSHVSLEIPFTVHVRGLELKNSHRRAIRRILGSALGRFSRRVRRLRVSLEDVNGPRGGMDIRCRIEVHLRPRGTIVVSDLAIDEYTATARAASRARELVDRRAKRIRSRRREPVR